ncbi:hypothetical protein L1049_003348 [Liquidambar formosana]|uniref:Uncharacterized protein n=1 Tax=Liquidambar formosana TaxID=63359 RepID=A0AAP0R9G9_LIQFO
MTMKISNSLYDDLQEIKALILRAIEVSQRIMEGLDKMQTKIREEKRALEKVHVLLKEKAIDDGDKGPFIPIANLEHYNLVEAPFHSIVSKFHDEKSYFLRSVTIKKFYGHIYGISTTIFILKESLLLVVSFDKSMFIMIWDLGGVISFRIVNLEGKVDFKGGNYVT